MNVNSFDIEAFLKEGYYTPYCVSFFFKNKPYSFYINKNDVIFDSIVFILNSIDKKEVFYIHNLKFDGTLIIYNLSKYNQFKINAIMENKEFYLLEISSNEKKIEFRCSYKLLPLSLQKISFGFIKTHLKIDYPYDFINSKTLFWKKEIPEHYFKSKEGYDKYMEILDIEIFTKIYCENDCYITKIFVEKISKIFISNFNIDIIKDNILSTPSLSFTTFYKRFNKKKVLKYIEKEKELYIRDSYFGGRCEVFGNPYEKNVFHFDFPGMYGLCMKEKNIYGESYFDYDIKINEILKPGFYNIDWYSNMNIPILPHHNQINNKLLFCNGEGNGTYWFEEINLFKEYGGKILKINSGLIYSEFDYVFDEFVDYFQKFRDIGDEHKVLGKLIINSFYGRTGLTVKEDFSFFLNNKEEFDELISLSEINNIEIIDIEEINNIYLITIKLNNISKKILEKKFSYFKKEKILNVGIASSIASKARIKLYKGFKSVEENSGRVLYCDTDSIFAEFKNNNVLDTKTGEILWDSKKDDTVIKDCVFISPKTYGIVLENKEIIKIKGITRNYIKFDDIKKKFYNKEKFMANNLRFMRYRNFKIENLETKKEIDLIAYDKRKFLNDFKNTNPFFFKNGEYI